MKPTVSRRDLSSSTMNRAYRSGPILARRTSAKSQLSYRNSVCYVQFVSFINVSSWPHIDQVAFVT
ncbi:hypothetical protein BpHYR1_035378 [Brachionus plicatilis]|uniref:Uncharacterized protein n=1 Tax=Brachionus plicatilis TaxID=10195 RepID=A0A3M7QZE2_BRAPC|nr:hypothetical protein BpHYR1_035378 [Brachionus plicatilis]